VDDAVDDAAVGALGALHHHRAGAVPEQHGAVAEQGVPVVLLLADRPVGVAHRHVPALTVPGLEAAVDLGAHHQHPPVLPGADYGIGELQCVEEASALLADVEAGNRGEAELSLQKGGRTRDVIVRGHGGQDQVIDGVEGAAGALDRLAGGGHRDVRGRLAARREAPLDDAGPHLDPLVGGVHDAGQVIVVDDLGGHVHTGTGDHRTHVPSFRTHYSL
jgi:hypothetical protein